VKEGRQNKRQEYDVPESEPHAPILGETLSWSPRR
jgi:hypothetical protein